MPAALTPVLDAAILVPPLIAFMRLSGLRSFLKMSAHDFAVTVATGSVVAATGLQPDIPWWRGAIALAALLAMQTALGLLRARLPRVERPLDNRPLVPLKGNLDIDFTGNASTRPCASQEPQVGAPGMDEGARARRRRPSRPTPVSRCRGT